MQLYLDSDLIPESARVGKHCRPLLIPAGTKVLLDGVPGRIVQGSTQTLDGEQAYTAPGTVSVRSRQGGRLYTTQVPVYRVEIVDGK